MLNMIPLLLMVACFQLAQAQIDSSALNGPSAFSGGRSVKNCDSLPWKECFYDANGQLRLWTETIQIDRPSKDDKERLEGFKAQKERLEKDLKYWKDANDGYLFSNPLRKRIEESQAALDAWNIREPQPHQEAYTITGYASIQKLQENFNQWASAHHCYVHASMMGYSMGIPATGQLSIPTLLIPTYKVDFELDILWSHFMSEVHQAYPEFPQVKIADCMVDGDELKDAFPNSYLAARAALLHKAHHASCEFSHTVDGLYSATKKWDDVRGASYEHLEADQLPEHFIETLSSLQADMDQAFAAANAAEQMAVEAR